MQDIEKIKVQYFKSLLFVLFEILKAVKVDKRISLDLNFVAMASQTRIVSLCSKTKDYCFIIIRRM